MIRRIIFYLFHLLIFTLPLGVLSRIKIETNFAVTIQDIVAGLIFIFTFIFFIKHCSSIKLTNYFKFQMLFIFIGLLSLIINVIQFGDINLLVSLGYLFRYLIYINLFEAIKIIDCPKSILKSLTISGIVFVIVGFLQLTFVSDLRPFFRFGWDEHLYRLVSTFMDPNFAGVQYILTFLLFVFLTIKRSFRVSIFFIVSSLFSAIASYTTYSRTALVSIFVGFAVYCFVFRKFFVFFTITLVGILFMLFISDFNIEGLNPFRKISTENRLINYKDTLNVINHNYLYGVGFNAYRYAQYRYGIRDPLNIDSNADAGSDNSYLFVIATTGIIGLIPFILSYIFLIKDLAVKSFLSHRILFIMTIVVMVSSLFINVLFYTSILAWFLIAYQVLKREN